MSVQRAYDEAISSGYYTRRGGLRGKYDNVRMFWEDEIIKSLVRPYVERLEKKRGKIRVLDMGCGYGDGYELVASLSDNIAYRGFDRNENFIAEAKRIYKNKKNILFEMADFSTGLPIKDEYDLYFTSYGSLSHNTDEQTIRLLGDIADRSDFCFVLCDWLGAYSYEWQSLWGEDWMEYRISYLPESGSESFPLRLMPPENIVKMVRAASDRIKVEEIVDRSVFVGRHMDTSEYNNYCKPLRLAVNSLFEPDVRTNLEHLLIPYHPRADYPRLNVFFDDFSRLWNSVIRGMEDSGGDGGTELEIPEMEKLKQMCESDLGMNKSTHRENVVEPQLGSVLRNLEMRMQRGLGAAHGLLAVLRIE